METKPASRNLRNICIVAPKAADAQKAAGLIKSILVKAGYSVMSWADISQAQKELLSKTYNVAVVVNEVWPDEHGDKFVQWLNGLPLAPGIVRIATDITHDWMSSRSNEEFYKLAEMGYVPDMEITGMPHSSELLKFVAMLVMKNSE